MRKVLSIILICLLCFGTSFALAVDTENTVGNTAVNTTDLQNKQKQVQNQIEQANDELSDLQLDITDSLKEVQKLDEKIETAEAELEEASEKAQILQA